MTAIVWLETQISKIWICPRKIGDEKDANAHRRIRCICRDYGFQRNSDRQYKDNYRFDKPGEKAKHNSTILERKVHCHLRHLFFAAVDALLGFKNDINISRSLGVEIMLYASAQRQIKRAVDLIGVKSGCLDLALVIVDKNKAAIRRSLSTIAECMGKAPDESVLGVSGEKEREIQRVFGISETEILATNSGNPNEALLNLVIERMALLVTQL